MKKILKQIKKFILYFLLIIFKYHLRLFYFFIKIFTIRKRRVFLLSRQDNNLSLNYKAIIDKLNENGIDNVYICKKVPSSINVIIRNEKKKRKIFDQLLKIIKYYFSLYKQMYYCATSKVIIIDGYNLITSILNHKKNTTIIQLWHAHAAIKEFGYQTLGKPDGLNPIVAKILCMHRNYSYVISGSKEMNNYFSKAFNVNIDKVLDIGTPTIDYMLDESVDIINKLYEKYPKLSEKENVLYVPTFRTDGSNDVSSVINNFDFDRFNLIPMLHPKYKNNINSDKVIMIDRNLFNTYDVMKVADYIITDYSALVLDSAIMNKKLLLYVYDYEEYIKDNGLNIDLLNELKGNVSKNFKDIMDTISNSSYNIESYTSFRNKYVNNFDSSCTNKIIELIKENL